MISNSRFQNCLDEMRQIAGVDFVLINSRGKIVAKTDVIPELVSNEAVLFFHSSAEQETIGEYMLFKVDVEEETEYVLAVGNARDDSYVIGRMAACQIRLLELSSREQMDRNRFMQNLLLGNMLPIDMAGKAKKLHIEDRPRVVFVVDTGNKSTDMVVELVKNLFDVKSGDFVTPVEANSVVLIRDVSGIRPAEMEQKLHETANLLVDNLHMEAMVKVRVGYGSVVEHIKDITQSFQEANMALEVGRVFYAQEDTVSYTRLGIGRLIYQLPTNLCDMFIKEVFGEKVPEILDDEESMSTINKFFENNLNISETARQLYVHRNTLVYRLERIQKAIGLDIRTFEDAMTFCIAVMVLQHMKDPKLEV